MDSTQEGAHNVIERNQTSKCHGFRFRHSTQEGARNVIERNQKSETVQWGYHFRHY